MPEIQPNVSSDPRMPSPPTVRVPGALRVYQVLLVLGAVFNVLGSFALLSENVLLGLYGLVWAVVALLVVWGINKRRMWAFYTSTILLGLGVVLSIVPTFSIITLVIDAVLLVLIFQQRSYFTSAE